MSSEHAPGVYFGMPEAEYHSDPALGSTDLKRLLTGGPVYWWQSPLNPDRKPEQPGQVASYLTFGRAVHKYILEGEDAFHDLYAALPTGDDVLVTDADLGKWFADRGVGKVPRSKAEKIELALFHDPTVRILDDIVDSATRAGITLLPPEQHQLILDAARLIKTSPDLAEAFQGGVPEVSIFWTDSVLGTPVRKKCRIDYLKVRGLGDLKSIGNTKDMPFDRACRAQIAGLRYDIQAAHYLEGRTALPALVAAGQVHGEHDPAWLQRVAAEEEVGWYWVFFHSGLPPQVWAAQLSPGNPILESARADIAKALTTYRDFLIDFGPDNPWVIPAELHELELAEMPAWFAKAA